MNENNAFIQNFYFNNIMYSVKIGKKLSNHSISIENHYYFN